MVVILCLERIIRIVLYALTFINICRYLQISRHASRYLVMSEILSRDLIPADRRNGKRVYCFSFLFC